MLLNTFIYFDFSFFSLTDLILDYCQKLIEKFGYPWEMMPLMYVILKDAGVDIDEASKRIEEGKCQRYQTNKL